MNYFWIMVAEYQTLIVGFFATGVATIAAAVAFIAARRTVDAMKEQIRQGDKHATDIRHRKARAARAAMPAALSALCAHAEASAEISLEIGAVGEGPDRPRDFDRSMPELDQSTIDVLKDCIEFSDDSPAKSISKLIGFLQLHDARLRGLVADFEDPDHTQDINWVNGRLLDAAELYARATHLFSFARSETDEISPELTPGDIESALFLIGQNACLSGNLREKIAYEYPKEVATVG